MNSNAAATYRQTLERTLPQADLLIRLYEGTIRCLDLMKDGMQSGDIPKRADAVNRVTGILSELASAIDGQNPKDLSESMVALYVYMIQEVTLANVSNEIDRLDPVRSLLSDLLETWRSATRATRSQNAPPPTLSPGFSSNPPLPRKTLSVRG